MPSIIELQTFYKHIPNQQLVPIKNEIGHFNIFKVEDMLLQNHKPVNYSRRNFFKVSLVTGHSKIHYADRVFEVTDSILVFTNPMVPYFWEIISKKQTGFICIFTEAFFSRFGNIKDYPVFHSGDTAIVPLNQDQQARFKTMFEQMYKELQGEYVYKYDLLRNLLMGVIHEAQKMQPATGSVSSGSNASERIAQLFAELLERQFPIELSNQVIQLHTASAFAKQLNIHVNHLNKALKEITGHTTSWLINERILQEAKMLLKTTSWTIAQIAWCLGFEEPNHFSGFFKGKTKTTPVKYRQSQTD